MIFEPPFANTECPETWSTLEDFISWYVSIGMPLAIPGDARVYKTDDSLAISLFRKGQYQAELYLIDETSSVRSHGHPNLEVIQLILLDRSGIRVSSQGTVSDGLGRFWGITQPKLLSGQVHGVGNEPQVNDGRGYCMIAFEKWPLGATPSTAAAVWKGETVGPIHEKLIRSFFPDAYIKDGYADISRTMEEI